MAFPSSGLFVTTFVDVLDTTQLAIDLDLETHKVALFTNSITANLVTDTAYGVSPWDANEVPNATGYTTGGAALTGTTFVSSGAGVVTFDASTDTAWTTSTFSAVRGCLIYADALAGDRGILAVNFGADYAVTSGTFTIQWNASGIFTIDLIP